MQSTNHQAVIETHGLRRVFKSRRRVVEAVAGVDLTVSAGEIFGFLGPNGAGKTTTLRMLTTLPAGQLGIGRQGATALRWRTPRMQRRNSTRAPCLFAFHGSL